MKRYYLIKATTKDGEFEYLQRSTMVREVPLGKELPDKEAEDFCQEWFGFEDSHQIVTLDSVIEISKAEHEVFEKYGI